MKKNRYLLCLLLAAWLMYLAIPRLPATTEGLEGTFTIAWLVLALMVAAGNLTGILYSPKQRKHKSSSVQVKRKIRSFNG